MAIYIGGNEVNNIYVGTSPVDEVYVGTTKVRPSSTPPVSDDYLCFTSLEANNILYMGSWGLMYINLEISRDKVNWEDYGVGDRAPDITFTNVGDKIYFRNKSTTPTGLSGDYTHYFYFNTLKTFAVSGDVNYLLCKNSTNTLSNWCFTRLFQNSKITTAPRLPATNLAYSCYNNMFSGCTSLITSPSLPAITVWDNCYQSMFSGCTSLITSPSLPATTIGNDCYRGMFNGCTSLATLPELPATTLRESCYQDMFNGCINIKLSATQTGDYQTPYRIPSSGTGQPSEIDEGLRWGGRMFKDTGGTFRGNYPPDINTTYYTSNTVV